MRRLLALLAVGVIVAAGTWVGIQPSNERDWQPNLAVLPYAVFEDSLVHVYNIRNTTYTSTDVHTPAHYDRTFDLNRLTSVWFIVEPFSDWGGSAHTFLSFGFEGPEYVTISVEARRERGETYHFLRGLLKRYELMYVVADERDAIKLRTNFRRDDVYLYPIRTTREKIRELFVAMLDRANQLRQRPEFYNTLTSNCTSNIVRHVNALTPQRIPFSYKWLFPGSSDQLAYEIGLIDTDLPFEQVRPHFKINQRALQFGNDPAFSVAIRSHLDPMGVAPPPPGGDPKGR
jgi:hypothetical protein